MSKLEILEHALFGIEAKMRSGTCIDLEKLQEKASVISGMISNERTLKKIIESKGRKYE